MGGARRRVTVHLNNAPDPEALKGEGYDVVIAATGAQSQPAPEHSGAA